MNKLIQKYNHQNNIVFISSYPEKRSRYSKKFGALGGFTKNIIEAIKEIDNKKSYIILTIKNNKKSFFYEDNKILVARILQFNNPLSFIFLIKTLLAFNKVRHVIIQYEFAQFGNIMTTASFLIIPLILRLLGKKQYLVLHQVVTNLKELTGHLGWRENDWKINIFNPLLKIYLIILGLLSNKIIVTEKIFKQRLRFLIKINKIAVIPHGVDTKVKLINKLKSREKLGLPNHKFIILYFGYIAWYKGADLLLKFIKKIKDNKYFFIFAGGKSPTPNNDYRNYLSKFNNLPKNAIKTGFVPEKQIPLYFGAADLVVLPYRTMMSSSGPLSLAFSFEKPVILSDKLKPYLKSDDFQEALIQSRLSKNDIFFPLNQLSFEKKLKNLKMKKLAQFSKIMKKKRNFDLTSRKLLEALIPNFENKNIPLIPNLTNRSCVS